MSRAEDQMRIDEILTAGQGFNNPFYKRFFINTAIAGIERVYVYNSPGSTGSTQGNCGDITYGSGSPNEMTPMVTGYWKRIKLCRFDSRSLLALVSYTKGTHTISRDTLRYALF